MTPHFEKINYGLWKTFSKCFKVETKLTHFEKNIFKMILLFDQVNPHQNGSMLITVFKNGGGGGDGV